MKTYRTIELDLREKLYLQDVLEEYKDMITDRDFDKAPEDELDILNGLITKLLKCKINKGE